MTRWLIVAVILPALLLASVSGSSGEGQLARKAISKKLGRRKFSQALSEFRQYSKKMSSDQKMKLREIILTEYWAPPDKTTGQESEIFTDKTFYVYLYQRPPFVQIEDWEAANGDPGNVLQTRKASNSKISGLTIDFLVEFAELVGCRFEFLYPCWQKDFAASGRCQVPSSDGAFHMLKGQRYIDECIVLSDPEFSARGCDCQTINNIQTCSIFFGGGYASRNITSGERTFNSTGTCLDDKCLVAGAEEVSSQRFSEGFAMTSTYLDTGLRMVVKEEQVKADLMAWAAPFDNALWGLVGAEILFCALCFMYTEGGSKSAKLETNPALPKNFIFQFLDCVYWAVTVVLGAADKGVETHAGRTLLIGHLFFAMILLSVYTGNINSFLLNIPTVQPLEQFQDLVDSTSLFYKAGTRVCIPLELRKPKELLGKQIALYPDAEVVQIEAPTLLECLNQVYLGDADCTLSDEPVLLALLSSEYYEQGQCGHPGGFCSNRSYYDARSCECSDENCIIKSGRTWTEVEGSLITTGEIFGPFGYAFGFRGLGDWSDANGTLWSVPVSQVVSYLREQGVTESLMSKYIPVVEDLQCAGFDPEDEVVQLDVINILGLLYITAGLTAVGCVIGYLEAILRFFTALCACCCMKGGKSSVLIAYENMVEKWEKEKQAQEERRIKWENRPEIIYMETDCDDPDAGARTRADPTHLQVTDLSARFEALEARLLQIAEKKELINIIQPDEPKHTRRSSKGLSALSVGSAKPKPPVNAEWLADQAEATEDAAATAQGSKGDAASANGEGSGGGTLSAGLVYKKND